MVQEHLIFMKTNKYLVAIVVLSLVLRVWDLGNIPPHLSSDEASLGYNAYSILKTGRDEYGKLFPIIFKSFGDYKPGLYIYFSVPVVAILGLTEFAIRLPSAIMGGVAVVLVYFLSKNILNSRKMGLFTAFALSINPWHIHFSRGAWEANLAFTLTIAGILAFLLSFEKRKWLYVSALFFGLTMVAYQGAKLTSLISLVVLILIYFKDLKQIDKQTLAGSFFVGLIISSPIIYSFFVGQTGRLEVFSIFSYPRESWYVDKLLSEGEEQRGSASYLLYHSELLSFFQGIVGRWFNHFSGRFLFFQGDWENSRHGIPGLGQLLFADLLALLIGTFYLIKSKSIATKSKLLLMMLFLLSPLPAALSRSQVNAVRSMNMVLPLVIILGIGMNYMFAQKRWVFLYFAMYIFSFIYFVDAYFVHLPVHNVRSWNWGYREMVNYILSVESNYDEIQIQQSYRQPYVYFLFYGRYDPTSYQKKSHLIENEFGDVGLVEGFDKYVFKSINWPVGETDKRILYIGDEVTIARELGSSKNYVLEKEIKYLDGTTAFMAIHD